MSNHHREYRATLSPVEMTLIDDVCAHPGEGHMRRLTFNQILFDNVAALHLKRAIHKRHQGLRGAVSPLLIETRRRYVKILVKIHNAMRHPLEVLAMEAE